MSTHIESAKSLAQPTQKVEYRMIPGCFGYKAGTDGSIWSNRRKRKWKQLTQSPRGKYLKVTILGKQRYVHRIILETFDKPCPEGMQARHFPDRNPANNCFANLSWSTRKVNERDKIFHGTHLRGERNPKSKLNREKVIAIRINYASGARQADLARQHGVTRQLVWRIVNNVCWAHLQ